IGLISYSAYLWHQPLFAFARHKNLSFDQNPYVVMLFLLLSLGLAYLSWKYIETPFRNRNIIGRKNVFILASGISTVLILVGLSGFLNNGFESLMLRYKYSAKERNEVRLISKATDYDMYREMSVRDCHFWVRNTKFLDMESLDGCRQKYGKALIVLGDSHAMNLFNIISYSDVYPFIIGVSQPGCRPHNDDVDCHYRDFDVFLKNNKSIVNFLIYHQSGSYFIKDRLGNVDSQLAFMGGFGGFDFGNIFKIKSYLNNLAADHKVKILWIGPFMELRWNPSEKLF